MNVVLLLLSLAIFSHSAQAGEAVKTTAVKLALNWKSEPEFGGFYAGKLAGSFAKRGLDVEITEGGAGTPVVQMVANGKVPFGIAAADEVVLSQARGTDMVALFAVYQTNRQGIMVHPERGFKSIGDVFAAPGTLAIQGGAPYTLFLQAKFANAKVKLVPYAGGIAQFLTDANYSLDRLETKDWALARALVKRCGDLGLLGTDVPERFGGIDLDKAAAIVVGEAMGGSASFSTTLGAQTGLAIIPILCFGTDAQQQKYLPGIVAGDLVGAYCLSESGSGADALGRAGAGDQTGRRILGAQRRKNVDYQRRVRRHLQRVR